MVRSRAVVVVTVLTAASILGWWLGDQRRTADQEYRVERVIDGDTIIVERGAYHDTIRLLGVDTPETHHPRKPVQCFGPEASAYTHVAAHGPDGAAAKTTSYATTSTGAASPTCTSKATTSRTSCCERATRRLLVIEPNHAHAREMLDDELHAKARRVGLWGTCAERRFMTCSGPENATEGDRE